MASRAKPAAVGPEVVGAILLLPVAEIEIGERLRSVDRSWAAALGKVMKAEGQHTEIEVCQLPGRKTWLLVAGAHRLTGAQIEEMAYIRAKVVENDPEARIAREISQELWRRDLDPLDRAAFISSQVALLKARAGIDGSRSAQSIAANARWQQRLDLDASDATETISGAYGFADEVGEMLGLTARTIRNDLMLQRIAPALVARLRAAGHPALRNAAQLRALAKLEEEQQAAAVDRLLWEEAEGERAKPMTLTGAIAAAKARQAQRPAADDKRLSAFIGAFQRMGLAEKKGALAQLRGVLPAGYRIEEGEYKAGQAFPIEHERYREESLGAIDRALELLEGLWEDIETTPVIDLAARSEELSKSALALRMARMAIVADAFELGTAA